VQGIDQHAVLHALGGQRFLRCSYCAFVLPSTALVDLSEFRLLHPARDDPDGEGEIYDSWEPDRV
jgi:hypothetical protein